MTKTVIAVIGLSACLTLAGQAYAGGDAEAGKALSAPCAACHGVDGVSTIATNPIIAGQYESYLVQALTAYRSGARANAIMAGFAQPLSDQDIRDLAAYFSSQESPLSILSLEP